MKKVLIIENVRSALNVGAMFRTASGLGVSHIYLVGITPTPFDPKGKKRRDFVKTALGSEDEIPWESVPTSKEVIEKLRREGYRIISIEQDITSVPYKTLDIGTSDIALIVGSEVDGIEKETRELSDSIVHIPMLGLKESLNVTIAFAIVGYHFFLP